VSRYRVEVRPAVVRALRKIDPKMRPRIEGAIGLLAEDPRPPASRPLTGRDGYRVRVGDYRIIYTIHGDVLLIVVVALGQRRDVYRSRRRSSRSSQPRRSDTHLRYAELLR
jgi:mRNA interferase RelE/StbE